MSSNTTDEHEEDEQLSPVAFGSVIIGCMLLFTGSGLFFHYGKLKYYQKTARIMKIQVHGDTVTHIIPGSTKTDVLPIDWRQRDIIFQDVKQHAGKTLYIVLFGDEYAGHYFEHDTAMKVTSDVAADMPNDKNVQALWGIFGSIIIICAIAASCLYLHSKRSVRFLGFLIPAFLTFLPTPFFFGFSSGLTFLAVGGCASLSLLVAAGLCWISLSELFGNDSDEYESVSDS
jgi:hypothetical protein